MRAPPQWRSWLFDQGSLTARLLAKSGGDFQLQVLAQRWALPTIDERRVLGLPQRQHARIREVLLRGRGTPWVYARSVLPLALLQGRYRFLARLDDRPLGALLFRDRAALRRGPFTVAMVPVPPAAVGGEPADVKAWQRRSVFLLGGEPLLVTEMFLPGFQP